MLDFWIEHWMSKAQLMSGSKLTAFCFQFHKHTFKINHFNVMERNKRCWQQSNPITGSWSKPGNISMKTLQISFWGESQWMLRRNGCTVRKKTDPKDLLTPLLIFQHRAMNIYGSQMCDNLKAQNSFSNRTPSTQKRTGAWAIHSPENKGNTCV